MAPSPRKPWHRWFGILLADQFIGRPWSVAMEEELALKSQRLDILIIERSGAVDAAARAALAELPDGFDDLAAHHLLSYKSAAEPFNDLGRFLRNQLAIGYGLEEIEMAYTVEDFRREAVKDLLDDPKSRHVLLGDVLADPKHLHALLGDVLADPKHLHALLGDVLADPKHLNALLGDVLADPKHLHALLERLVAEDRLRELTPEERLRGLAPDERLCGLDPDTIEAWLNEHRSRDH